MRISDWSSDVCSSDLARQRQHLAGFHDTAFQLAELVSQNLRLPFVKFAIRGISRNLAAKDIGKRMRHDLGTSPDAQSRQRDAAFQRLGRSEEHTSELQSLMRNSYAVFCFKKNKIKYN